VVSFLCIYTCIYIYTYPRPRTCIHIYIHSSAPTNPYIYIYTRGIISIFVNVMYIYIYIYGFVGALEYAEVCFQHGKRYADAFLCVYIYIYVHSYTLTQSRRRLARLVAQFFFFFFSTDQLRGQSRGFRFLLGSYVFGGGVQGLGVALSRGSTDGLRAQS